MQSGYPIYPATTKSPAGPIVGKYSKQSFVVRHSVPQFALTGIFKQSFEILLLLNLSPFLPLFVLSLYRPHRLPPRLFWLTYLSAWVWLHLIYCATTEVFTGYALLTTFAVSFHLDFLYLKKNQLLILYHLKRFLQCNLYHLNRIYLHARC